MHVSNEYLCICLAWCWALIGNVLIELIGNLKPCKNCSSKYALNNYQTKSTPNCWRAMKKFPIALHTIAEQYKTKTNTKKQRTRTHSAVMQKGKKNTQENITRAHERRRIENHGRKMRAHCHTTRPPTSTFHMHESLFMCSIYASLN